MRGHLRKRGRESWEIKIEASPRSVDGRRHIQYHTVRGSRRDAERALTAILAELDSGSYVAPSALTMAEFLTNWLDAARDRLAPKTAERYDELCRHQIATFLGAVKCRPSNRRRSRPGTGNCGPQEAPVAGRLQRKPSNMRTGYCTALSSTRSEPKYSAATRLTRYRPPKRARLKWRSSRRPRSNYSSPG
jgi:hypothetical protein